MAKRPNSPQWVDNAVFYEVYPQSFYDTNGDGIGDLPGIIEKLDYIKSLHVNAIWLNPCFVSPMRDAGYDIADFYKVDPRYGTNQDMKKLFKEAHKRGIHVILDLVVGHTSIDHPWFKESAQQKENKFSNWYIWTKGIWSCFNDNKWNSRLIHGYGSRDGSFLPNFFWSQPALNFGFATQDAPWQLPVDHPACLAVREEMKKIMRFWLDMGADGFRVDMAGSIIRNDPDHKEKIRFWQEVRGMINKDYPEAFLVSEWSSPDIALKAGFHADFLHWFPEHNDLFRLEGWKKSEWPQNKGKHSYFRKEGKGDITRFLGVVSAAMKKVDGHGYMSIPIDNHDMPRLNMDRDEIDLEIAHAFLLTMPGIPFLYYGDEIGMRQLEGDYLPIKEGCYPPRNGSRTPMQWTKGKNFGFSKCKPNQTYLPMDPDPNAPNVNEQEKRPDSLLNRIRKLVELHANEKGLAAYAEFIPIYAEKNKYPLIFMRVNDERKILVIINPSKKAYNVSIKLPHEIGDVEILNEIGKISIHQTFGSKDAQVKVSGCSYCICSI